MTGTECLLARMAIEELNVGSASLIDNDRSDAAHLFSFQGSYGAATGERSVGRKAEADERVHGTSFMTLFAEEALERRCSS